MISFACPGCSKQIKVKDELAGKKGKCPGCGIPVAVPQPAGLAASQVKPGSASLDTEKTLPPRAVAEVKERSLPGRNRGQSRQESLADARGKTGLEAGRNGELTQTRPEDDPNPELWDFLAPAEKPDEIGRLGSYRVLKVLGAGGMGVVFRAEDPGLQRLVALKAMLPTLACSPSAKERFIREARAAAALKHPHIVTIFQVGEDRGAPFLAMEFLEGEALDDRLKRETRLPVPEILRIGRQIAEGLAAAHDKGLIHRDIKPANIWLEGNKAHVKILDFGLARAMGDQTNLTQSGAIIGTPAYMAPEQAGGNQVDQRCDLFSLGCVLYRMCTGEMTFKGKDTISILSALALANPSPPQALNAEVQGPLSDLVLQMLSKKPEERPESAQAVVQALQDIEGQTGEMPTRPVPRDRNGKAGADSRVGATARQSRRPARKPLPLLWLVGGGVVGLGLLAAAIVLLWPTPRGLVRIESDDPNVEVVFDKSGPTVKGADKEPIALRAGEHGVLIKRGDFAFETDKFVLKKGETITLKVELLQGKVQVVQDGKVIASRDIPLPKTFTNSLGMEFVLVPKGKSWLGGGAGQPGDKEVEIVQDFYLGKYEVTQEEWEKVMGTNPSGFKAVPGVSKEDQKRFPLEMVSWDDAQVFLKALNGREKEAGWVYRLPKDVEWEYACRGGPLADKAGSGHDFYVDKAMKDLTAKEANIGHQMHRTCKVGSYKPNTLGLDDMHGNVWEWCEDEQGASASGGPGRQLDQASGNCRAAHRHAYAPSYRHFNLGVRLARVPTRQDSVAPTPKPAEQPEDAWRKQVAGMSPVKQVEAVVARLKERNPDFDGNLTPKSEGGVVTEVQLLADQIRDIAPVRAFAGLQALSCNGSGIGKGQLVDLSPLKGLKLTKLSCGQTAVFDLSPLEGMQLTYLDCDNTRVNDLSSLKGMPLTHLDCHNTPVNNLSPLKGLPLTHLDCQNTQVTDLLPLEGMKLTHLDCDNTRLSDLSPLKGMPLTFLNCHNSRVIDLSPLKGMPLTTLDCNDTKVSDLSPLKGMPLTYLNLWGTQVIDLSPLKGMPLTFLHCGLSPGNDLSPLKGMPLTRLNCSRMNVTDLSPLKGMPLTELQCDFKPERDAEILRSIKTLQSINNKSAAEFWKDVDPKKQEKKFVRATPVVGNTGAAA